MDARVAHESKQLAGGSANQRFCLCGIVARATIFMLVIVSARTDFLVPVLASVLASD
jgi:hypothetical protein